MILLKESKEILFLILVVLCVILPSGTIININVKMLVMLALFFLVIVKKINLSFINLILYYLCIMLFFSSIAIIKSNVFFLDIYHQAKDLLIFIIIVLFYIDLERDNSIFYKSVISVIIKSLVFVGVLKCTIYAFYLFFAIPIEFFIDIINDFFGVELMKMGEGVSVINRLNFNSDYLLPIAIFIILLGDYRFKKTILAILLFSCLVSLSRIVWFNTFFFVIGYFLYRKNFLKLFSVLFLFLAIAILSASIYELIQYRLFSYEVDVSDSIRIEQFSYIKKYIYESPIFGNGIGFSIKEYIRSEEYPYSYELQIPAFIMQVGFLGILLYFFPIIFLWAKRLKNIGLRSKIICFLLFSFFLCGAFFNPILLSSFGVIGFLMLFLLPSILRLDRS